MKKSLILMIFCFQADINVSVIMFLLNTKHIENLQEFYMLEIFPRCAISVIPGMNYSPVRPKGVRT